MTPHTAFGIRLIDGLMRHQCNDDVSLASRKEPLSGMHDLRAGATLFLSVTAKNPVFGAEAERKLDFQGDRIREGFNGYARVYPNHGMPLRAVELRTT